MAERVVDAGAWFYPEPISEAPPALKGMIAFYWNRIDNWFEEDEEVFVHPRDPYHRIDVLRSDRHVRVLLEGEVLAESERAIALFESNLPARWYLPPEDVLADVVPSDTVTHCPYKGQAAYFSVRLDDGELVKDLIWVYDDPHPEVAKIAGLLCFFNERVELELDGELTECPETPWSHGVRTEAPAGARGS